MKNLLNKISGLNKGIKILLVVLVIAILLIGFKNPLCIGLMYIVDFIGAKTNSNVVNVIDFLNDVYYFSFKECATLNLMTLVDNIGNCTGWNVSYLIDLLNEIYYL